MYFVFCRVEAAFRKFDTDGDGFIDWEEFKQVDFKITLTFFYFSSKTLKALSLFFSFNLRL